MIDDLSALSCVNTEVEVGDAVMTEKVLGLGDSQSALLKQLLLHSQAENKE
jgi:hypothetical protein